MAITESPHPVETLVQINACHFCGDRATHGEACLDGRKVKTCCKCFSVLLTGDPHEGSCASIAKTKTSA